MIDLLLRIIDQFDGLKKLGPSHYMGVSANTWSKCMRCACLNWAMFGGMLRGLNPLCFVGTWLLTKGTLWGYVPGHVSRYVSGRYLGRGGGGGAKHRPFMNS